MKEFRHPVLNKRSLGGGYKCFPEEPLEPECILQRSLACDQSDIRQLAMEFSPIFYCYRNPSSIDLSCMLIILEAIKSGILICEVEFIYTNPDITEKLKNTGPVRGRTIESAEHKGMKHWVKKHLEEKGINAVVEEAPLLGYEVDVASLSNKIFIECGDTEPRKVFDFLRNNENVGILQYSSEDIIWFITTPEFIKFAEEEWLKLFGVSNTR